MTISALHFTNGTKPDDQSNNLKNTYLQSARLKLAATAIITVAGAYCTMGSSAQTQSLIAKEVRSFYSASANVPVHKFPAIELGNFRQTPAKLVRFGTAESTNEEGLSPILSEYIGVQSIIEADSGEEVEPMLSRITKQREQLERIGNSFGLIMAVVTILITLVPVIPFRATVPAAVMFLSISGLMRLRRFLREGAKCSILKQ